MSVIPEDLPDLTSFAVKTGRQSYDNYIEDSASRNNVDPDYVRSVIGQESGFKPRVTSPKGASGLMQLIPATAKRFGVTDIYDPKQNIEGGTKYLKFLLDKFHGNVPLATAGYNAGEGAVEKYGNKIPPYAETQNYVKNITSRYKGNGYHPGLPDLSSFTVSDEANGLPDLSGYIAHGPNAEQPDGGGVNPTAPDVQSEPQVNSANPVGYNGKPMLSPADVPQQPPIPGDEPQQVAEERLNVTDQPPAPTAPQPPMSSYLTLPDSLQIQGRGGAPAAIPTHHPTAPALKQGHGSAPVISDEDYPNPTAPRPVFEIRGDEDRVHQERDRAAAVLADENTTEDQRKVAREQIKTADAQLSDLNNAVASQIQIPDNIKTQAEANAYVNGHLRALYPDGKFDKGFIEGGDAKPGDTVQITYGQLKGAGVDTKPLLQEQVARNRVENPTPDLRVGKDFTKDDAESLRQTFGNDVGTGLSALIAGGGDTAQMLGSLARAVNEGTGDEYSKKIYEFLKETGETGNKLLENSGEKALTYDENGRPVYSDILKTKVEKFLGKTAVDLARLEVMGAAIPGAGGGLASRIGRSATLFGTQSAAQSAGAGQPWGEVTKQGLKGAGIGAAFGVAGDVADVATDVAGTLANRSIPKIFTTGTKIGTVFGSTYGIARLAGDTRTQAFQEGVTNAAFEFAPHVVGKVAEFFDGRNKVKANISENGDVTVAPPDAKADVTIEIPKEGKARIVRTETLKPIDTKEVEKTDKVQDKAAPQPEANGETVPEVAQEPWQVTQKDFADAATHIHGTSSVNAENIAKEGFKLPTSDTNRHYPYSQYGADSLYVAPKNTLWFTDPDSGRMAKYDEHIPVVVNGNIVPIRSDADMLDLAKKAGYADIKTFLNDWDSELDIDPKYRDRSKAITDKLRSQGIDGIALEGFEAPALGKIDLPKSGTPNEPQTVIFNEKSIQTAKSAHRQAVEQALKDGKDVPREVLADYPDLTRAAESPVAQRAREGARGLLGVAKGEEPVKETSLGENAKDDSAPVERESAQAEPSAIDASRDVKPTISDAAKRRLNTLADIKNLTVARLRDPQKGLSDVVQGNPQAAYDFAIEQSKKDYSDDPHFTRNFSTIATHIAKEWPRVNTESVESGSPPKSPRTKLQERKEALGAAKAEKLAKLKGGVSQESAVEKSAPEPTKFTVDPNDIPLNLARAAYHNTSFSPEKRADQVRQSYVDHVTAVHAELEPLAKTDEQKAILDAEMERYKKGYVDREKAILSAQSRTASSMITGPANFPVERNRKRMETVDKRTKEFLDWDKKAQDAIEKRLLNARSPEIKADERWQELKKGIDQSLGWKSSANLAGRLQTLANNGDVELLNKSLDHIRTEQAKFNRPLFTDRHSIWKLPAKAEAVASAVAPTGVDTLKTYEGAKVVNNKDLQRVQILFDEKPSPETIKILKKSGWRWSPREGAWQRQNTQNGINNVDYVLKQAGLAEATPVTSETFPSVEKAVEKPELSPDLKPFENNKIVTADDVQKARDALKKIQFNAGLDPEAYTALVTIGAAHVEAGARKFAEFSKRMIDEFGEKVKPHLEALWNTIKVTKKELAGEMDEPNRPSSIMHAEINADRENRGWDKLSPRIKQSNPDLHAEVKDIIAKDPDAPLKTFEKFAHNPKAVPNTVEGVLLNAHLIDTKIGVREATRAYTDAMDKDDPLSLADAKMSLSVANAKLDDAQKVAWKGGSERGAALQSQKMFATEDFEYTNLVQAFKAAKGRAPNDAEIRQLQQIADEHKAKSEALEAILAGKDQELANIKAQLPPRHILDIAENYVNKLHNLAEKERERLRSRGNVFTSGIDPRDLKSVAIIGADHLANMSLDFAKWSDKMVDEFGDKIKPHLEKLFGDAQKVLQGGHAALKSDADIMSRTLKSQKTRMENRIKELENAIKKQERITRNRTTLKPDAELEGLQARVKSLKEDYDAIFPTTRAPLTDAKRLQNLEKRLEGKQKSLQEKVQNNDLSEPTKRNPLDPFAIKQDKSATAEDRARATRIMKAQAEVGRIEKRYARMKQEAERASEPITKWGLRKAVNFVRGSMLSAVTVIEKLGAASIGRTATSPVKTAVGYGVSKLIPGIARKAAIEGSKGFINDVRNEANATAKAYTTGIADIVRTAKGTGTDLSDAYGRDERYISKGKFLPFEASQFIGLMHDSLKAPAFRGEYERVLGNLITDAKLKGQDVDNETMFILGQRAYNYAQRVKFQEKFKVSDELGRVMRDLDNGDSTPKQALGAALHILIPIHRISTNVVKQSLEASPLGLGKGIVKAASAKIKGLDNLTDDQADIILRNIKNGSVGTAMYALGLFAGGKVVGSFYQKYDKDKDKDVAKYNTVQIDGVRIPAALLHLPEFNSMFMGATTKRIYEESRVKGTPAESALRGAGGGVASLVEEAPGLEAANNLVNIYHAIMGGDKDQMSEARYGIGNFVAGRTVPGIVRNAAEWGDQDANGHFNTPFTREPRSRKIDSKTFGSSVKTQVQKSVPWWRNRLPDNTP